MRFVCMVFLISWTAYYQRRLRRLFPVIWKDSVEDTGNTALESYFFSFSQKHKKTPENKKKKRKRKRSSSCWHNGVPLGLSHELGVIQCTIATLSQEGCSSPDRHPCPRRPPLALLRVHPRRVLLRGGHWAQHTATSLKTSALDSNADLPAVNSCSSKSHLQPNIHKSSAEWSICVFVLVRRCAVYKKYN